MESFALARRKEAQLKRDPNVLAPRWHLRKVFVPNLIVLIQKNLITRGAGRKAHSAKKRPFPFLDACSLEILVQFNSRGCRRDMNGYFYVLTSFCLINTITLVKKSISRLKMEHPEKAWHQIRPLGFKVLSCHWDKLHTAGVVNRLHLSK